MNLYKLAGPAVAVIALCGCSASKPSASVAPTFTPAPTTGLGRLPSPAADSPVVRADCLRSLSSYRFTGSFSLKNAAPAPTGTAGQSGVPVGSLANLLGDVKFQGSAQAPDRYQATLDFGTGASQPLEIIRIGPQSYSRFGNAVWQPGDQSAELGGIGQLDPETLCERNLAPLSGTSPAHETVNGIASLRYQLNGRQLGRGLFGDAVSRTATATPGSEAPAASIWVAEKGGYPVRYTLTSTAAGSSINLQLDISDVNGKDIQINPPR
jgi:hypothetical protein